VIPCIISKSRIGKNDNLMWRPAKTISISPLHLAGQIYTKLGAENLRTNLWL
jgi:hypothetical protein